MRVTADAAHASLYVAQGGSYQLYVEGMEREGVGDLYLRFEALKNAPACRPRACSIPRRKRALPLRADAASAWPPRAPAR